MLTLELPAPITQERISFLESKGVDPKVARLDLEMIKMKMSRPEEGLNWTPEQIENAEVEYKRYLTLCIRFPYPKYSIVPNEIMDTVWHYHILDTKAYHADCERVFGHYFHHFPYFGLRGEQDAKNLASAGEDTVAFYEQLFGEAIDGSDAAKCWHDCQSRCWHACNNQNA